MQMLYFCLHQSIPLFEQWGTLYPAIHKMSIGNTSRDWQLFPAKFEFCNEGRPKPEIIAQLITLLVDIKT